jgi:hypothetical protein
MKDKYNINLLIEEIREFDKLFSDHTKSAIILKRENLEMIKKIIEYFLNYIVELNFDSISNTI